MARGYLLEKVCIVPANEEMSRKLMALQNENFNEAQKNVARKNSFQACQNQCIKDMRFELQNTQGLSNAEFNAQKSKIFKKCADRCKSGY
jgi:hypothetical protein